MPADRSTGYIRIRYNDGSISELDLPIINSIEMTMTTQLTELDTIIYGYENRFIIDLGTVQRYTLELERVNPFPYNDSNSASPEQWSNGKWYLHLESMLNKWQTLFRSFSGDSLLGAFLLHIDSGDTSLYPDIDKYVVVSGSMSVKRTVQKMTISLPLTVARLPGSAGTANTMTVTFDPGEGSGESFTQSYATGFSAPLPNFPTSWVAENGAMAYQWESDDGSIVEDPGKYIIWTSSTPTEWHATWQTPYDIQVYTTSGDHIYTVDRNCRVISYAVGGGGGAGGYANQNLGTYSDSYWYCGGAGASGQVSVRSFNASPGNIHITVGRGGAAVGRGEKGINGGDSIVTYLSMERNFAKGGSGGSAASYSGVGVGGGTGGVGNEDNYSYSGGSTGPNWDSTGSDGEQGTGADAGIAGKGRASEGFNEPMNIFEGCQGGAGGGASDFNYVFNGVRYQSQGGDGGIWRPSDYGGFVNAGIALYGGGAGSSGPAPGDTQENGGGDGIVVLVLFER